MAPRRVVLIIQARMGSTRLPAKSMMDLAGAPLVGRILERVTRCRRLDEIVLAVPDTPQDAVLGLRRGHWHGQEPVESCARETCGASGPAQHERHRHRSHRIGPRRAPTLPRRLTAKPSRGMRDQETALSDGYARQGPENLGSVNDGRP